MEPELRRNLFACGSAYAHAKGIELVTVARLAAGDWRFFERVDAGASFTARKYDLVMGWFAQNWPEDAPWPADVPRAAAAETKRARAA